MFSNPSAFFPTFCANRITVFVPVEPKVLEFIAEIARILKFVNNSSRVLTYNPSLLKSELGSIIPIIPFGFKKYFARSIKKHSIELLLEYAFSSISFINSN